LIFGVIIGKQYIFSLSKIYAKICPFSKGETVNFFLCLKEKSCKKEANQHAVGLPASMEAVYRKAHSTLRESTMLRHCYYSLGERVFRRSWFFGKL
jgi:hypothetical protein